MNIAIVYDNKLLSTSSNVQDLIKNFSADFGKIDSGNLQDYLNTKIKIDFDTVDMIGFGVTQASLLRTSNLYAYISLIRAPRKLIPIFLYSLDEKEIKLDSLMIKHMRDKNLFIVANISLAELKEDASYQFRKLMLTFNKFEEETFLVTTKTQGFNYCSVNRKNPITRMIHDKQLQNAIEHKKCTSCSICLFENEIARDKQQVYAAITKEV